MIFRRIGSFWGLSSRVIRFDVYYDGIIGCWVFRCGFGVFRWEVVRIIWVRDDGGSIEMGGFGCFLRLDLKGFVDKC